MAILCDSQIERVAKPYGGCQDLLKYVVKIKGRNKTAFYYSYEEEKIKVDFTFRTLNKYNGVK